MLTTGSIDDCRRVKAVHSSRAIKEDPSFEIDFSGHLRKTFATSELESLFSRFSVGEGEFDVWMRRNIWRAIARKFGHGIVIGSNVSVKHLETFEFGDGVYIGSQSHLQGRFDGVAVFGKFSWIGPQSFLDARCLEIGEYVGWGPGAKVLGSTHTGFPENVPIIDTDLEIRPVCIGPWADIGTGAIILPGVTIGKGSIIGAGAVVTRDVPDYSVAVGIPAKVVRRRNALIAETAL